MIRYKLVDSEDTSSWGWKVNPVQGKLYKIEELREMYGEATELYPHNIEYIIDTWLDEDWEKEHGRWIEVTDKLIDND